MVCTVVFLWEAVWPLSSRGRVLKIPVHIVKKKKKSLPPSLRLLQFFYRLGVFLFTGQPRVVPSLEPTPSSCNEAAPLIDNPTDTDSRPARGRGGGGGGGLSSPEQRAAMGLHSDHIWTIGTGLAMICFSKSQMLLCFHPLDGSSVGPSTVLLINPVRPHCVTDPYRIKQHPDLWI